MSAAATTADSSQPPKHRRRRRYSGKFPRRYEEKYKEHQPERYQDTIDKVLASGKTPAGTHRPIMVEEILEVLAPKPGEFVVDCTLGYGGHALALLDRITPGGSLLGLDADPIELPKTEARLRELGYSSGQFLAVRSNFAGLAQVLAKEGLSGADAILADLGVSSMQLDNPERGFSFKDEGPLDMRMNPRRGQSAAQLLAATEAGRLHRLLRENADEPHASVLAGALAGRSIPTTAALAAAVRQALQHLPREEQEGSVRRVFQALRIAVNDEFSALETFLRHLPACLNPDGRVAILTFHSGEDRRVKRAFEVGLAQGIYGSIATEVLRPGPAERRANPRSSPAKLRWARRA